MTFLPNTAAYTALVNFYNDVRASVQDLESKLEIHLQMMESLTARQVTPHLTAKIQELSCVPEAEFDKIEMDTCIKVDTGLYCTFYISTYSATTSYKQYIPVKL
jgi:UDP-galactopyranose mutase